MPIVAAILFVRSLRIKYHGGLSSGLLLTSIKLSKSGIFLHAKPINAYNYYYAEYKFITQCFIFSQNLPRHFQAHQSVPLIDLPTLLMP